MSVFAKNWTFTNYVILENYDEPYRGNILLITSSYLKLHNHIVFFFFMSSCYFPIFVIGYYSYTVWHNSFQTWFLWGFLTTEFWFRPVTDTTQPQTCRPTRRGRELTGRATAQQGGQHGQYCDAFPVQIPRQETQFGLSKFKKHSLVYFLDIKFLFNIEFCLKLTPYISTTKRSSPWVVELSPSEPMNEWKFNLSSFCLFFLLFFVLTSFLIVVVGAVKLDHFYFKISTLVSTAYSLCGI